MKETAVQDLSSLSDEELLKTRLCDLNLKIRGTWLEACVDALYKELKEKKISLLPACYLADEWLSPEHEPVVGVAFFLAHPRLMTLEAKMMHEVEGGDDESCMRLLRHEAGHAINYAYQLYKRKRWRQLFGHFSAAYPDRYKYKPYSKNFVTHLEEWYSQYHPDEDFAETFAVWLDPKFDWKSKYRGWRALQKLEYVDELMKDIAKKPPKKKTGKKLWSVCSLKMTLKTYYKRKTEFYAEYSPDFHDDQLKRIFQKDTDGKYIMASKLIRKYKKDIINHISFWTGEKKYTINQLLKTILKRCRELKLEASCNEIYPVLKITVYMTALTMNYKHTGRFKRTP